MIFLLLLITWSEQKKQKVILKISMYITDSITAEVFYIQTEESDVGASVPGLCNQSRNGTD